MYSTRPGLILGFHGCDSEVANKVIQSGENLYSSENQYDWLGTGIYFWEHSPERALHYANELKNNPYPGKEPIKEPAVIGAVIDLGLCLDLVHMDNLKLLQTSYKSLRVSFAKEGIKLPRNLPGRDKSSPDLLRRKLDCLVINSIHRSREREEDLPFDSVRGSFWEGRKLYPTAGFRAKNHIQIAIRNPNCVKGYFLPRSIDSSFGPV